MARLTTATAPIFEQFCGMLLKQLFPRMHLRRMNREFLNKLSHRLPLSNCGTSRFLTISHSFDPAQCH